MLAAALVKAIFGVDVTQGLHLPVRQTLTLALFPSAHLDGLATSCGRRRVRLRLFLLDHRILLFELELAADRGHREFIFSIGALHQIVDLKLKHTLALVVGHACNYSTRLIDAVPIGFAFRSELLVPINA